MQIELATLKRIAKATPELTIAQLVAVLEVRIEENRRDQERVRIAEKRQQTATPANNEQQAPTYEQQEAALYAFAKTVCGARAGGLVTDLLKQNGRDLVAVRAIFDRAQKTSDPKAFVAATIRKQGNGAGTGIMDTFDRLIAEAKAGPGAGDGPLLDITPTSSRTG